MTGRRVHEGTRGRGIPSYPGIARGSGGGCEAVVEGAEAFYQGPGEVFQEAGVVEGLEIGKHFEGDVAEDQEPGFRGGLDVG